MVHFKKSNFEINESVEGRSIEDKMRETTLNGQPIESAAPLIYTDRRDGVLPEYDIRTDRWNIAQATVDKVVRSQIAKSQEPSNNEPTQHVEPLKA